MSLTNPTPPEPFRSGWKLPSWRHLACEAGPLHLLARAEGYVMVRRGTAEPFVMQAADWDALRAEDLAA